MPKTPKLSGIKSKNAAQSKAPAENATILKTITKPYMRITSDGSTSYVGGQLTATFAFTSNDAQCIVFSGAAS